MVDPRSASHCCVQGDGDSVAERLAAVRSRRPPPPPRPNGHARAPARPHAPRRSDRTGADRIPSSDHSLLCNRSLKVCGTSVCQASLLSFRAQLFVTGPALAFTTCPLSHQRTEAVEVEQERTVRETLRESYASKQQTAQTAASRRARTLVGCSCRLPRIRSLQLRKSFRFSAASACPLRFAPRQAHCET